MPAKPSTYARNPEQLARALEMPLSPRKRKKSLDIIADLIQRPDFPQKTAKGWVVAEVKQWLKEKAESGSRKAETENHELPGRDRPAGDLELFGNETPAEKLQRRLDLLEKMYFYPEAFLERKIQKWEVEELKSHRPYLWNRDEKSGDGPAQEVKNTPPTANNSQGVDIGDPAASSLPDAESQKMLAVYLAKHFAGRITIDIGEQQISNWKKQIWSAELPGNTPAPPPKVGHRFDTQAWADWVEKYILPYYRPMANGQGELHKNLMQMAQESKYQQQVDEAAKVALELGILKGKYIERAVHEQVLVKVGVLLNQALNAHGEKEMTGRLVEGLKGLGLPERLMAALGGIGLSPEQTAVVSGILTGEAAWVPLVEMLRNETRAATDRVRGALAGALREAKENAEG